MNIFKTSCITAMILSAALSCGCGKPQPPVKSPSTAAGVPAPTAATSEQQQVRKFKAGLIYVGPVGDYGWSNAHELARLQVMKKIPWLQSIVVESVPEADSARVIDRLILEEKCDAVFTTSFGYMDATVDAAKRYPNKLFMHCSGYKREKNLGTYFAELYETYYLCGLMAGALSKTGKIGYVGAHPIPEVVRHINAFAIGIREINPEAKLSVKWLFSWYDPAKAKEAAEALVAEGCDAISFTEDSPAVIQVGEAHTNAGKPVYTFSHYSAMLKFGENSVVSGQLVDWTGMYEKTLSAMHTGTWQSEDLWWLLKEGAAVLGADFRQTINYRHIDMLKGVTREIEGFGAINAYDLVNKRLDQMKADPRSFDPFTGPIKDQTGAIRIPEGHVADHDALWSMDWFVEGVEGRTSQ
ncbi:MAG: BMP family ABC transporter substrate-binding protein [Candidatus Wallbacteria bacterium]|nr:BMP family ABC transporter substrate-binding protein [Candidatus Wallbacteria bacterium]